MKRITLIFIATLILVVLGTLANYSYNNNTITTSVSTGDNLAIDENIFVDIVFDKEGHLLENSVYEWNTETNTKGRLLISTKNETMAEVLNDSEDIIRDFTFDKNGNLISEVVYSWDKEKNCKSSVLAEISNRNF
ncbi:MAG: hypothetical protein K6G73_04830 [Marinilabiliaceae bacterium]|nr:hypothetical protein [Marinilabiliaceae bacterium]